MSDASRQLDLLSQEAAKLKKKAGLRSARSKAAVDFRVWRDDPVGFAVDVLGFVSATRRSDGGSYQFDWMRSVLEHPRTALCCAHGVGKTRDLAVLAIWWTVTRPNARCVICGPQFERQVRGVVFAEIRRLVTRSKIPLPIEVQSGRAAVAGLGDAIVGLPATEPDRIEGQHAEGGLLLIMDETKGVAQPVYDALQGSLTGGDDSRLLVASTPGGTSGPFYKACTDGRGLWQVYTMSAEDSSLVSPQWCQDREIEWGKDSALYVTRVQGQFAALADGALFSLELLEKATLRPDEIVPTAGSVVLGVDVARSVNGDQNCICVTRGGVVERFVLWRSPDLEPTIARIVQEALATNPTLIRIDSGGLGGGPADRLRALGFRIEAVNFGTASSDATRYANKRSELYWSLRESLEKGSVKLPDDDELMADLLAQRFEFTQAGKVQLLPKDEVRKRLGRSPDRADALVLSTFTPKTAAWNWVGFHEPTEEGRARQRAEWQQEAASGAGFQTVAELPIDGNNAVAPLPGSTPVAPVVARVLKSGWWEFVNSTTEIWHNGPPPGAPVQAASEPLPRRKLFDPHTEVRDESD